MEIIKAEEEQFAGIRALYRAVIDAHTKRDGALGWQKEVYPTSELLKGNFPAERLYEGLGFRRLHTLQLYYEDTGLTDFGLYEYAL